VCMGRGISYRFVPGPSVVKTVTHEDVTFDQLGGADAHATTSGVAHFAHDSELEALAAIRTLLSYLPSNNLDDPPVRTSGDPVDRRDEELLEIVPDSATQPYDMHEVIRRIVDHGEFFEVHKAFAENLIVGFAVMGPKGAVEVLYKGDATEAQEGEYREKFAHPYLAAARGYLDDIIDPRDSRPRLIEALTTLATKRDRNPPKKHGNIPL